MARKTTQRLNKLLNSPDGLTKIAQSMLAPLKHNLNYESRIRGLFDKYMKPCVKCKTPKSYHNKRFKHPHFDNNLEMLEWEYEKKDRV